MTAVTKLEVTPRCAAGLHARDKPDSPVCDLVNGPGTDSPTSKEKQVSGSSVAGKKLRARVCAWQKATIVLTNKRRKSNKYNLCTHKNEQTQPKNKLKIKDI